MQQPASALTIKNPKTMETDTKPPVPLFSLCEALLSLETLDQAKRFLRDLCTPKELKDLEERWRVCQLLQQGELTYRQIQTLSGASLGTITRVARFLKDEPHQGYRTVLGKLNSSTPPQTPRPKASGDTQTLLRRAFCTVCCTLLMGLGPLSAKAWATPTAPRVCILQTTQHVALERTTQGLIDGLTQAGFESPHSLVLKTACAQGSVALAGQMATAFISQEPQALVGIGTLAAQSFLKHLDKTPTPLVFASVTDPQASGLMSAKGIYGVSNWVPLEPQLALFMRLQPGLKRLGMVYNPGEINSVAIVKRLEDSCKAMGLVLVAQVAVKTADVPQAALQLASQVDAIFISNDNTALSSLETILAAGQKYNIPVYVSDTDAVARGALAALGPNQYELGMQAAQLVATLLRGQIPDQAVVYPQDLQLYLNATVAGQLGIVLPKDLLEQAAAVIGGTAAPGPAVQSSPATPST